MTKEHAELRAKHTWDLLTSELALWVGRLTKNLSTSDIDILDYEAEQILEKALLAAYREGQESMQSDLNKTYNEGTKRAWKGEE